MKIYIAGRYGRREELAGYRDQIEAMGLGHTVTSSWLNGEHESMDGDWRLHPYEARNWAANDLADIDEADVLLAITGDVGEAGTGGGRHVEWGYAVAKGKALVFVGPIESIFYLQAHYRYETWDQAFNDLMSNHRQWDR